MPTDMHSMQRQKTRDLLGILALVMMHHRPQPQNIPLLLQFLAMDMGDGEANFLKEAIMHKVIHKTQGEEMIPLEAQIMNWVEPRLF